MASSVYGWYHLVSSFGDGAKPALSHCVTIVTTPFSGIPKRGSYMTSTLARTAAFAAALTMAASAAAIAQQPAAAPKPGSAAFAPDTGAIAPDFSLVGVTQAGAMKDPVKLSN